MNRHAPQMLRALLAACLSTCALSAAHAGAPWTSSGSTGTLDETTAATDTIPSKVSLNGPEVTLLAPAALTTASVRYNVTNVFNLGSFVPYFEMRFLDSSANTRVTAELRAFNFSTGSNRLLAYLDSNTAPPSPSYQTMWACGTDVMQYSTEVYYVVVTLSRNATTGSAGLAALRIFDQSPC